MARGYRHAYRVPPAENLLVQVSEGMKGCQGFIHSEDCMYIFCMLVSSPNDQRFPFEQMKAELYLEKMLHSPPEEIEVQMRWGNRYGGGSKDNPYLKDTPRFNTYTETIHPQKICKGLMEIREQLLAEWVNDLAVVQHEDQLFWGKFNEEVEFREAENITSRKETFQADHEDGDMMDLVLLGTRGDYASSPLRGRNFDVLKRLSTYIAVKKLLARRIDDKSDSNIKWLGKVWDDEYKQLFETSSGMSADDSFLTRGVPAGRYIAEMFLNTLARKPSMAVPDGESLMLVEPKDVVQQERRDVIQDWIDWLNCGDVGVRCIDSSPMTSLTGTRWPH
eukprot:755161-Hanusia_phi.AAC.9